MNSKIRRSPQGLFALMRSHPYFLTICICAILLPFGFAERAFITGRSCLYLGVVLSAITAAAAFFFQLGDTLTKKLCFCCVMIAAIAACMLIICFVSNKAIAVAVIALIAAAVGVLWLRKSYGVSDTSIIALLIFLGVAIRFVYILYTGSTERQHDAGTWYGNNEHLGYIVYWFQNGLKLPDFDVRSLSQYYHPPLHHLLMAGLLKLLMVLGVDFTKAREALQILPMMYSCLTMIVSYRVFRHVKLRGTPLIAAMGIICFHPTFIIFAGSYNNDMLLMLFMTAAVMWGLRWYSEPVIKNIIPLALCVGLGMMTKLSGWMVAPAIAFLFLIVLLQNIRKPLRYFGQYAVFGVICIPLGLWWQVRNRLMFGVPLHYIPIPFSGPENPMYAGDVPLAERLFSFTNGQLSYVYGSISFLGAPYNEYNPTIGLFKTAMFDECSNSINDAHFPQITITGPILFWISVALFLLCFGCFVCSMVKKSDLISGVERGYFAILFFTVLICYYLFAVKYPYSCTYNIRYTMLLIPLCAMGMAMVLQKLKKSKNVFALWFKRIMYALTAAFCVMSYVVYTQVGSTI